MEADLDERECQAEPNPTEAFLKAKADAEAKAAAANALQEWEKAQQTIRFSSNIIATKVFPKRCKNQKII